MYINLRTGYAWKLDGEFAPALLFASLGALLTPHDILVVGTYEAKEEIYERLQRQSNRVPKGRRPYSTTFRFNTVRYPRGRAFEFSANQENFDLLASLAAIPGGGIERECFVDHFLCFRPGSPIVPLLDYHDAFLGGDLMLTGLYDKEEIKAFTERLGVQAEMVEYP